MHSVLLIQLILSLAAAAVLLSIGIIGLMRKDIAVSDMKDQSAIVVSEWVLIGLGVLLLGSSIAVFVVERSAY